MHLSGSAILIGAVSAMMPIGWLWPQFLVAAGIEYAPKKMLYYTLGAIGRTGSGVALCACVWWFADDRPYLLAWLLLAGFFAMWSSGGIGAISFMDIVTKAIPEESRARLFAWRNVLGGLLAIGAGWVVKWVLSDSSGFSLMSGYLLLLGTTVSLWAVAMAIFIAVKEPVESINNGKQLLRESLKRGPRLLKHDPDYRILLLGSLSMALTVMVLPFFVPYLIERVGMETSWIGTIGAVTAALNVVGFAVWVRWSERRGNRTLIVRAARIVALAPALACMAVWGPTWSVFGVDGRVILLVMGMMIAGAAARGAYLGRMTYVMEIAPAGIRATYFGFMNSMGLIPATVPIVAGIAVETVGYNLIFGVAMLFGLISSFIYQRLSLPDEREQIEQILKKHI